MLPSYDLLSIHGRLKRIGPVDTANDHDHRAAVAVMLHAPAPDEEVSVLFIRRAEREGDPWSGHVAFPGGRRDKGDRDLLATVIRETREEVGFDLLEGATLLARMPDEPASFQSHGIRLTVAPFVFATRALPELAPNHEVAGTLWVPLRALARGDGAGTHVYRFQGQDFRFPCIRVGEHVIWGLTLWMLQRLLRELHRE